CRDPHRPLRRGVQPRLSSKRLVRGQLLDRDPALLAAVDEVVVVGHVLVRERDEQAVVLLERAGAYPAEDRVLLDALDVRIVVTDGVARARMQEPVMAAGRPRRELAAFHQRDEQSAEREVVRQCAARPAASADQHVGRGAGRPRCRQRHLREYRTTCRPWRLLLVLLVLLVLLALGERSLVMLVLLVRLLPGREVTVSVRSIPSHGVLPSPFGLVCARNVTPPNRTS